MRLNLIDCDVKLVMSQLTKDEHLSLALAKCSKLKRELQSKNGVFIEAKRLCLEARAEKKTLIAQLSECNKKCKKLQDENTKLNTELQTTKQLLDSLFTQKLKPKRKTKKPNYYRC